MKKRICILLALLLALHLPAVRGEGTEKTCYDHATIGNPTLLNGCFFTGMWGNITSDMDIRDLTAGYRLVKWDGGFSQYRFDHSVVSGAVSGTDRDGNRHYVITLCDGLYFSDGTPVTAWDYAFSVLLQCSPLIRELDGKPAAFDYLLGYEDYSEGRTKELAGVRVGNDRQITFIVRKEALPYFFELARFRYSPYPVRTIAPGCRVYDSGNGAYIGSAADPAAESPLTAGLLRETILDPETGYLVHPDPGTGPYRILSFDGTTAEFTLNPWYKGNEEGDKPRIKDLTYTLARYDTMMDGLAAGDYTVLNKVMPAQTIRNGMELCLSNEQFTRAGYLRTGLACFYFMPASPAAGDETVRRAAACCLDKEQFTRSYVGSFGTTADGLYGMGQWMYQLAAGSMEPPVRQPADATDAEAVGAWQEEAAAWKTINLDGLTRYACDPEQAGALLDAAGWNLNADGEPYRAGTDTVRYRDHGGSPEPLRLSVAYPDMDGIGQPMEESFARNLREAGFDVTVSRIPIPELDRAVLEPRDAPYDMIFLGQNFSAAFDPKGIFSPGASMLTDGMEPDSIPAVCAEMLEMAQEMERTDREDIFGYMKKWVAFQERLSECLPVIPVFINVYSDFYSRDLHDYRIADKSSCGEAIVPARLYAAEPLPEEERELLEGMYGLALTGEPVEDLSVFETGHRAPEAPDPGAGALAAFPREIREQIPDGYRTVNEFVTVSMGEAKNIRSMTVKFTFETKYPAGDTVYLLFGVKRDNRVAWFVREASVTAAGSVSVVLEKEQLDLLAGTQFPLVVASRQ